MNEITVNALFDEFEKIAAAKWREVARAGGEGLKRLERAGLRSKTWETLGLRGAGPMRTSLSMPQHLPRRGEEFSEAQRFLNRAKRVNRGPDLPTDEGAARRMFSRRRGEGQRLVPEDIARWAD